MWRSRSRPRWAPPIPHLHRPAPLPTCLPPSGPAPAALAGNTFRQNLLSTGAFEVSYQGTPVFSKLDTNRMPNLAELVEGITEAMTATAGSSGSIGDGAAYQ